MKTIALSQGRTAIVDDEFYDEIARFKWFAMKGWSTYYAGRNVRIDDVKRRVLMHRYVAERAGLDVSGLIDHRNGNGLDNRVANLRPATVAQNRMNSRPQSRNECGFKGVRFNKKVGRWVANITVSKRQRHLGYFDSPEEAAAAYDFAAMKHFGAFARCNRRPDA
jgi:hypothetical protein